MGMLMEQKPNWHEQELNTEWSESIRKAKAAINRWLPQYNHVRPHHVLGVSPPVPEALPENKPKSTTVCGALDSCKDCQLCTSGVRSSGTRPANDVGADFVPADEPTDRIICPKHDKQNHLDRE